MRRLSGGVAVSLLTLMLAGTALSGPAWAQAKPDLTVALSSFSTETLDPALGGHLVKYYLSMILQDPMSSLNPVFSIGRQVREPVSMYHGLRGRALQERAAELLAAVRIPSPAERLRAFPHQLSGGM